jgi:hypothetical protein
LLGRPGGAEGKPVACGGSGEALRVIKGQSLTGTITGGRFTVSAINPGKWDLLDILRDRT